MVEKLPETEPGSRQHFDDETLKRHAEDVREILIADGISPDDAEIYIQQSLAKIKRADT